MTPLAIDGGQRGDEVDYSGQAEKHVPSGRSAGSVRNYSEPTMTTGY